MSLIRMRPKDVLCIAAQCHVLNQCSLIPCAMEINDFRENFVSDFLNEKVKPVSDEN